MLRDARARTAQPPWRAGPKPSSPRGPGRTAGTTPTTSDPLDMTTERADLYATLGVRPSATQAEISHAYRALLALRDQGEDLRLSIGKTFSAARPLESDGSARPARRVAHDHLAGVHRFERGDEFARRQRLGQVSVRAALSCAFDEFGVKVPGIDHN